MTAQPRQDVWFGYLDASRQHRYHTILADHYLRLRSLVRGGVLILSLVPMLAYFDARFGFAGVVLVAAVAFERHLDYGKKQAQLAAIASACADLEIEWQSLWSEVNRGEMEDHDAASRNRELVFRLEKVTRRGDEIRISDEVNERAATEAYQVAEAQYSAA